MTEKAKQSTSKTKGAKKTIVKDLEAKGEVKGGGTTVKSSKSNSSE